MTAPRERTVAPRRRGRQPAGRLVLGLAVIVLAGCSPADRLRARLELKRGNESYLRGDFTAAVARYDAALRLRARLPRAHLNRAYATLALFRSSTDAAERRRLADQAVRSFTAYLEQGAAPRGKDAEDAPSRERIEQHMLTLYLDSQQPDAAVRFLEARLAANPRDASAIQMLGRIEAERGNLDAALGWQRRRTEVEPGLPEAHYALGTLAWQLSYRDPGMDPTRRAAILDEGLSALLVALRLRPDYYEALVYVGLLDIEKAKYAPSEVEAERFRAAASEARERALELRESSAAKRPTSR